MGQNAEGKATLGKGEVSPSALGQESRRRDWCMDILKDTLNQAGWVQRVIKLDNTILSLK